MDKTTIVLQSGDFDKVYSAFIIGNGALGMGMECSIYVTFWGLQCLRKGKLDGGPLSKMNMFGIGKWFMKRKMGKANVRPIKDLVKDYKELGGKIIACDMTMEVMGCKLKDLDNNLIDECGSVGTFIEEARNSKITLYI